MMHYWGGSWGVGNWLVMGFGMVVFWGLVAAGVIWLVRALSARDSGGRQAPPPSPPVDPTPRGARDILDERYARGEIDDDEYRTRRDTLAAR